MAASLCNGCGSQVGNELVALYGKAILDHLVDALARSVREPGDFAAARARTHTQQSATVSADESFLTGNTHTFFSC